MAGDNSYFVFQFNPVRIALTSFSYLKNVIDLGKKNEGMCLFFSLSEIPLIKSSVYDKNTCVT